MRRLREDRALAAGELAAEVKATGRRAYVLGDGWEVFARALTASEAAYDLAPEAVRYQNAWGVCLAAMDKQPGDPGELLPVYLRLSQAERERQERLAGTKN